MKKRILMMRRIYYEILIKSHSRGQFVLWAFHLPIQHEVTIIQICGFKERYQACLKFLFNCSSNLNRYFEIQLFFSEHIFFPFLWLHAEMAK